MEVFGMPMNVKNAIAETFWALTNKKHIDKITVKDIVEECGISRQTFYYHFQDIIDVIEWSADQKIQQMIAQCLKAKTPEEGIRLSVSFFYQNKKVWNKLLASKRRTQFEHMAMQAIHEYMMELLKYRKPDISASYADVELVVHFFTYGIGGVFMEYANRNDISEEQFANQLIRILSEQQNFRKLD